MTRPPTLKEIAQVAGVHPSTVSQVMRNSRRISPETSLHVRAVAEQLGYRPDPHLAAFNRRRLHTRTTRRAPALALITDIPLERARAPAMLYFRRQVHAMQQTAEMLGHPFTILEVPAGPAPFTHVDRVLEARGIEAVILAIRYRRTEPIPMRWSRLSAVKIEMAGSGPPVDVLSVDQCHGARLAFARLTEAGCERVGLATRTDDETRTGNHFETGVLMEQFRMPENRRMPRLELPGELDHPFDYETDWFADSAAGAQTIAMTLDWISRHRVDGLMSNWNGLLLRLAPLLHSLGLAVRLASLDRPPGPFDLPGTQNNYNLLGQLSVERVSELLRNNQLGLTQLPSSTRVPPEWVP